MKKSLFFNTCREFKLHSFCFFGEIKCPSKISIIFLVFTIEIYTFRVGYQFILRIKTSIDEPHISKLLTININ